MSRFESFVSVFVFSVVCSFVTGCPPGADIDRDGSDSGSSGGEEICTNTCAFAGDGECDDCGEGSDYSVCDIGTDCDDCGARTEYDECEGGSGGGGGGGGGGCTSYSFTCQYCSGSGTCSGDCPSSCYSLCEDACASAGCGSVISCY